MEADSRSAQEAGGVLNPGGARGPDGQFYLFPRLVAAGNFSRIGLHEDSQPPQLKWRHLLSLSGRPFLDSLVRAHRCLVISGNRPE